METLHIEISAAQNPVENRAFQGVFGAYFYPKPFKDLVEGYRWGFNNETLLMEALERQKQFVEIQYAIDREFRQERPDQRTVTLRCVNIPGKGLLLAILGRVCAQNEESARVMAEIYWREVKSIFPYDYVLTPAQTVAEFRQIAGWDLLIAAGENASIRQIKRLEKPMRTQEGMQPVLGLWQSGIRATELVWRALAGMTEPALLNISIHPTVLHLDEMQTLWEFKNAPKSEPGAARNIYESIPFHTWIEPFINRRLGPWKKFFFMQVHVVTYHRADESLLRSIGSTYTRDGADVLPGYEIARPANPAQGYVWCKQLYQLELPEAESTFVLPRLSNLADIEEVVSVFRFPYPPAGELPGVQFIKTLG